MPIMRSESSWRILLVHGAGSTGATADALFAPLLSASIPASWQAHALEDRTGDVHAVSAQVAEWLTATRTVDTPTMVAGISLGAHAAVLGCTLAGSEMAPSCVIAALPAWLGSPDETANLTRIAGDEIADCGIRSTLARITAQAPQARAWVVEALNRDWPSYTEYSLSEAMRTAAGGPAPTESDLQSIDRPVLLLGMTDDPFHPYPIAERWAQHLPDAQIAQLNPEKSSGFASDDAVVALRRIVARVGTFDQVRTR